MQKVAHQLTGRGVVFTASHKGFGFQKPLKHNARQRVISLGRLLGHGLRLQGPFQTIVFAKGGLPCGDIQWVIFRIDGHHHACIGVAFVA